MRKSWRKCNYLSYQNIDMFLHERIWRLLHITGSEPHFPLELFAGELSAELSAVAVEHRVSAESAPLDADRQIRVERVRRRQHEVNGSEAEQSRDRPQHQPQRRF